MLRKCYDLRACQCPWILKHMLLLSEDYQVVMASHCICNSFNPNPSHKEKMVARKWGNVLPLIYWELGPLTMKRKVKKSRIREVQKTKKFLTKKKKKKPTKPLCQENSLFRTSPVASGLDLPAKAGDLRTLPGLEKTPQAMQPLSLCTTTIKPVLRARQRQLLEPLCPSQCWAAREAPAHHCPRSSKGPAQPKQRQL